ncbi:MAG: hypothetical protein GX567_06595 [Clostridia bacterium]|nr:hypothetical protein [Clostridia bacterium]
MNKMERTIRNTVGCMALEGMKCTEEEIKNLKRMLSGEVSARSLIEQYKKEASCKAK